MAASTYILPPTLVHAFLFVSNPIYFPVLVHTSTPVPESTDTVIDIILRLNCASTENILPFCLKHCLAVALPVGLHDGVVRVTTGKLIVGDDVVGFLVVGFAALGFVVGDDDIGFFVGFAVLGFEEEGLDDGFIVLGGN
jgi:hypothetical protein